MSHSADINVRPDYDNAIKAIADYVIDKPISSDEAYDTARWCLMDSLGCALLALNYPECVKMLGPIVPGATLKNGATVPGTAFELDPVRAAFNIGAMVRWLDFNDTWLAAEWGHPSDNLGSILAVTDYLNRQKQKQFLIKDVLTAAIKAHEIQGIMALKNSFNRIGIDHVVLVKLASAAVATYLLGGTKEQICAAISQVWVDGQSLRAYRHAPNTGSRKSWAAGDAASRAVWLALMTLRGEVGSPSALTAKKWGFYDVMWKGKEFEFERDYASYVMEHVLFKIAFPAEFHAQTAVEAAIRLHPLIKDRFNVIEKIVIKTQESAMRIINKTGPLYNYADRDHCIQYMTAIGLIYGELKADHYEDKIAQDARIDALRDKMQVIEEKQFSIDYLDPSKRSIGNAVQVFFKDGTKTEEINVEYPIGHRRRRAEGLPLLEKKFITNVSTRFSAARAEALLALFKDKKQLEAMPVDAFMNLWNEEK